ncbi:hypothetical protein AVEN_264992-1 [Araneus ventricosus]|uniref:Uncharacterized protein n=1 Tax=Araneus ventricosus TaxID=182803 RepID=A0A4Y2ERL5_ARAVE|nr:hypothetical protein AVEN_264992-1 [Araneus ventricosus]
MCVGTENPGGIWVSFNLVVITKTVLRSQVRDSFRKFAEKQQEGYFRTDLIILNSDQTMRTPSETSPNFRNTPGGGRLTHGQI